MSEVPKIRSSSSVNYGAMKKPSGTASLAAASTWPRHFPPGAQGLLLHEHHMPITLTHEKLKTKKPLISVNTTGAAAASGPCPPQGPAVAHGDRGHGAAAGPPLPAGELNIKFEANYFSLFNIYLYSSW